MAKYELRYGDGTVSFEYDEKNVIDVINANIMEETTLSSEEVIKNAVENPIGTPKLEEMVTPQSKVVLAIGDKTRLWTKQSLMIKVIMEKLGEIGVPDENVTIISCVGGHPSQTPEEIEAAVGADMMKRVKEIEHNSYADDDYFTYLGTTKMGTPVYINKIAQDADCLILLGGVVYHFLAGFGGGRKMVLPGLCSQKTIIANHIHSLGPNLGDGTSPFVKVGAMDDSNPFAADMMEASKMAEPEFIVNVVVNDDGKITHAFAGDMVEAHQKAVEVIIERDGVPVKELADMAIVSGGGYPKDINLYQSTKPMVNAAGGLKDHGIMILLHEERDGVGHADMEKMLVEMDTTLEREKYLRENYNVGRNLAFYTCEMADKYDIILVSSIDEKYVKKTNLKLVRSIDEALELAYKIAGRKDLRTYIMPYGSNTLPILQK